ncbi:MAG: hypothetical protein DKM50_07495 [Candidatus Margulisiibacteriota bacterium]|nr:MAG: hypothetical protein A2X43_05940 [Candidatus Margulisbacteria bacterium GWD2_39_127]OGI02678.1 MAG: hypothetical protein A2X42_00345 [Candidatus Margulisbacteria bacterium GWF2_38_17]OGI05937.1 MAG: hypothetical protein A2X41_07640 [Candidatus Margulisbacteria bacterium GWE2_39_32]PZM80010.1 MAG: hypothetical protein DKM50_07495 [Candidatus Margulisiibacteriota bacterium]HAR62584.1 hypothetical protein [Candidatus Margulisiibacteriota bacterium]
MPKMSNIIRIRSNIQGALAIAFIALNLILFFVTRKVAYIPFIMIPLMIISVFWFSRAFCGWACPRAAFLEKIISRVSLNKPVPKWMNYYWVSLLLLTVIVARVTYVGLNKGLLAAGFLLCVMPTIGALLVGWYSPKSWCTICPTGTILKTVDMVVGKFKVSKEQCNSCRVCDKACPMSIELSKVPENSSFEALNCTQCSLCVDACPKSSIKLPKKL